MNVSIFSQKAKAYLTLMRLPRPAAIFLLYWPCAWGLALSGVKDLSLYALFFLGALLLRSAGCIYNDLIDRDFDTHVARTRHRPLTTGLVKPREAWVLISILLSLGALILFSMETGTILLGLLSIALLASYPFMKRITFWPQLFLGFTFNWGVLMGQMEGAGTISLSGWILYAAGIFWTLVYDTAYGCQDVEDDLKLGLKSTSILFKNNLKLALTVFLVAMALCLGAMGTLENGSFYYFFLLFIFFVLNELFILYLNPLNPLSYSIFFTINGWIGGLVFAMIWILR